MAEPGDRIAILVDGNPVDTEIDDFGVQRFIENEIVSWLFESGQLDLNRLYIDVLTRKMDGWAYMEFYMSLGYTVDGFSEVFGPGSSWEDNGREPVQILNPLWEETEEKVH